MGSRAPFGIGEWYHCFNRGVDKRLIFENAYDYERFLLQMYIGNGTKSVRASGLRNRSLPAVLSSLTDRGEQLVEIGAYALMPNHFHFLLQEVRSGGIALFMQKICTGYTMYFNNGRGRTGALLAGTFKSRHVYDDRYLKQVVSYVLLNPAELFEPRWKEGAGNIHIVARELLDYPYSSLPDFFGKKRLENKIIGTSLFEYYDKTPSLNELLRDAQFYYKELQV